MSLQQQQRSRPLSPLSVADNAVWKPSTVHLKGVFGGSGSDSMYDPRMSNAILDLVGKPPKDVNVVYIGTATYDLHQFRYRQTRRFVEQGCNVQHLRVTDEVPVDFKLLDEADVVIVGGGNTLFALDRWRKLNLVPALRRAMERGCVMCGGSAGAICWFDGGHSNSMDPDTYKAYRMERFGGPVKDETVCDEIDAKSSDEIKDWKYIRITALGFFPGLVSPHHDKIQSNGVFRGDDFDKCLLQHPGEVGIGIDHWAAIVVDGDRYRVLTLDEKGGSVGSNGELVRDGSGKPGVWIKEVINGKVESRLCPREGRVVDLFLPATEIVEDIEMMNQCRRENPDDGPLPANFFKQNSIPDLMVES